MTVKAVAIEPLRLVNEKHGQVRFRLKAPNISQHLRPAKRFEAVKFFADDAIQRCNESDGVPGRRLRLG